MRESVPSRSAGTFAAGATAATATAAAALLSLTLTSSAACRSGNPVAAVAAAVGPPTKSGPPPASPLMDLARVSGARIDESAVRKTITVDPARGPVRTLAEGFRLAHACVAAGEPTRLVIRPGVYREAVTGLDWAAGEARDTLLVIEGAPGKTVWTGADIFPFAGWRREGGLLVHPWRHRLEPNAPPWGPKGFLGHRAEMAFVGDAPLRQRVLERYKVGGIQQDPGKPVQEVTYAYEGFRGPAATLKPGEFGVVERPENAGPGGPKLYVRPPAGLGPRGRDMEVSTRRVLLDLTGKSNVVLRGITFTRAASGQEGFDSRNAVAFGWRDGDLSRDVLIDRCRFAWNNNAGLRIAGEGWTVRDSSFDHNGSSGVTSGRCRNVLLERNDTSFNVWRAWRGGEIGYYTGGVKLHEASGVKVLGHTALGNCTAGLWWDVHCKDVYVEDALIADNTTNLQFELSQGPFHARRLLVAGGRSGDGLAHLWNCGPTLIEDSLFWTDYEGEGRTSFLGIRWSDRDDGHAKMEAITAGEQAVTGSLFVGGPNVRFYAMLDDVRDPARPGWRPVTYRGEDNAFYSAAAGRDLASLWLPDTKRRPDEPEAKFTVSVPAWRADGRLYSERSPRRLEKMPLRDPAGGDWRVVPGALPASTAARLPSVQLTKVQRRAMAEFFAWSGFTPDRWDPRPEE